ncbi:hypothetical protein FRC12_021586 [Ceratobasidium sp. 428]|nr:hypothetical protein FRC12_021586 [Ceratobasidium sp. 428]
MNLGQKDMARRFITFIDACYESKTKLFVSSEVPITRIFSDESSPSGTGISDHQRGVMDDLVRTGCMRAGLFAPLVSFYCSPAVHFRLGAERRVDRPEFDIYWRRGNLCFCAGVFTVGADGYQGVGRGCSGMNYD